MNERRSLYRKVAYIALIGVLFIPLYLLGHPASIDAEGKRSQGGLLAQQRDEYHLSQATLGEIDPASQTMELATLGLRGVATQILWQAAHNYQMKEDWFSLSAVVDQIIKLQPNFWSVWDFQSHNLSYNISVEFDDYHERFNWVMKGIDFLKKGLEYNATDPRFIARIGWVYGNKIGRADEHVQYRKLFAKMQEDKGEKLKDNWLVSNFWYKEAEKLVDSGRPLRVYIGEGQDNHRAKPGDKAPSPVLFFSEAAMSLINYADNIEEEGIFESTAKNAWENAAESWKIYADRILATAYGYSVRMSEFELYKQQNEELQKKLDALVPGEMEKLHQEKIARLPEAERKLVEKKLADRTIEERNLAAEADLKTSVCWEEVALRAPANVRPEARKLAEEIAELRQKLSTIDTFRDIVNYNYWWARCQAEPSDDLLAARKLMYDAGKKYEDTDLLGSKAAYEEAFEHWRKVLDKFPALRTNNIMADELVDEINKYKLVIGKLPNTKLPEPFILQDMIDLNEGKKPADEKKSEPAKDLKPTNPDADKSGESKADSV